jgi:hypothetical protein
LREVNDEDGLDQIVGGVPAAAGEFPFQVKTNFIHPQWLMIPNRLLDSFLGRN